MPLAQVSDHSFMKQLVPRGGLVVDLGANKGVFAKAMASQFGCRCFLVEANPQLCERLSTHEEFEVLNAAVANDAGSTPFYIRENDESSSMDPEGDSKVIKQVEVPMIPLPELLRRESLAGIDLLKMDIEGAEIDALDHCPEELLLKIPQITVEFHDFNGMTPTPVVLKTVERMRGLGFEVIQVWMRSYGDTLFINRKCAKVSRLDVFLGRTVTKPWWWVSRKLGWRKVG